MLYMCSSDLFFFQAEDGIRDIGVTGVQTCALPIFLIQVARAEPTKGTVLEAGLQRWNDNGSVDVLVATKISSKSPDGKQRSEERRVGKECRSRWSPYH